MELFPRNEIYVTANRENGYTSSEELNTQNFYTCGLFEDDPEKNGSMNEEIDIIDGVHFISFESESDLFEFTRKQKVTRKELKDRRKMYGKKGRVILKKTHNISKLKEWRNSSTIESEFGSCSTDESGFVKSTDEAGCVQSTDESGCVKSIDESGCLKSTDESGYVKSTDDSGCVKSTDESGCVKSTDESGSVKSTDESGCVNSTDESDHKIKQTVTDVQNDTTEIVTADMISNNRIFLREFPDMLPRIYEICFSEKYTNILTKINNIYLDVIKKDTFLKKIQNKLSNRTRKEGVFQCSLTDEFLEKHDNFEVSYAKRGIRHWDEAKLEEAKELLLMNKSTKLSSDIIDVDDKHKENLTEEVAEAFAKFDAFAKKTNKFKLKNYIVIGGQSVQLDFGESINSDSEVKNVVDDAIDYILRKEALEKLDCPFDPDINPTTLSTTKKPVIKKIIKSKKVKQKLGRLINEESISISNNENSCGKEFCTKGCVCLSLEGTRSILHCKKIECMFKCSCDNKNNSLRKKIVSHGVNKNKLGKKKSLWHNTVNCKSNDVVLECETEVKNVVEDAIDYILRKEAIEKLDYPFDPDINPTAISTTKKPVAKKIIKSKVERELGRPINVTLVKGSKSVSNNENSCEKEYCSKGCVCQSLEGTRSILHCEKRECMFKCTCDNKNNSPREKTVSSGVNKTKLGKEESLMHKTVICKSNDIIIGETGKAKREKKIPTRFRNNVLLYSLDTSPNTQTSRIDKTIHPIKHSSKGFDSLKKPFLPKPKKKPNGLHQPKKSTETEKLSSLSKKNQPPKPINKVKEPVKDVINVSEGLSDNCNLDIWKEDFLPTDFDEESWIEMEEVIVSSDEEELVKVTDPLDMAYIWCGVHNAYNCQCCNSIFFLKTNTICRCGDRINRFSQEHVSAGLNSAYNFCMAHLHDRNAYSARTFGTHINYGIRNKRSDFKKKRELEMHYGILSNTNSLYKLSILQLRVDMKKEKIAQDIKPSVIAHNVRVDDIVVSAEPSDTLDDLEETKVDDISKPLSPNHQPLNINQFVHIDQQQAQGQSPHDSMDQLTLQQTANIRNESGSDADEKSVEPEKVNSRSLKVRKPRTYRIGPAHFYKTPRYRQIVVSKHKPKFRSCDSKTLNIDKNQVCDIMSNSDPPILQSSQNTTTDNLNSSVNIVSGKDCVTSLANKNSVASETHNLGLLCLTDGFGYLPVNHFSSTKLSVRDPLLDFYHNFEDLKAANIWLNRFFKNRILFEDLNYDLKWIIIKPNLMSEITLFDKTLLLYDTKVVNKSGVLMDKALFTTEYIRASKKLQFQTYKADKERTSFPANKTIKYTNDFVTTSEEQPNKRMKLDSWQESFKREKPNSNGKTRIINLGNHTPGTTKRYKLAKE